jgi:NAD(P)-dependent dehydrogenase (short-subunit alcohol dehydrogenase family)
MTSDFCSYHGKIALLTGAAGHIAATTARLLAARGASIAVVARPGASLDFFEDEIPADRLLKLSADATDPAAVQAYVQATVDRFGRIDVFFNAAGVAGPVKRIVDYPVEDYLHVMNVNALGVFLGLKYVLPVMEKQRGGVIVNACSIAGLRGSKGASAYSASKHAVLGLTKVAANESAGSGIRVVGIAPGPVDSPMFNAHIGEQTADIDAFRELAASKIPQGRLATGEDIANLVCFLASDQASYINGVVVPIDGALTAG